MLVSFLRCDHPMPETDPNPILQAALTDGPHVAASRRLLIGPQSLRAIKTFVTRHVRIVPLFLLSLFVWPAQADDSAFGQSERSDPSLIGILYDLKQTPSREKSKETEGSYLKVLAEFLDEGWNEAVLNRFYRVTRPLYSTQIWIPPIDANEAPKAFGVGNIVAPRMWPVHYKGQVTAPEDGTYRFVGFADNVMAVAVNSQTVLVSYIRGSSVPCQWTKNNPKARSNAFLNFREPPFDGDWIDFKKGQPVDLDIILGERPGGGFCAFLMIEKKGETYKKSKSGKPILPVFQLAPKPVKPPAVAGTPWKALD